MKSLLHENRCNSATEVVGAGAATWMCASNDIRISNGTDKASIDASKCLQSILVKGDGCIGLFFLLCSPDDLILVLLRGLQHCVPPGPPAWGLSSPGTRGGALLEERTWCGEVTSTFVCGVFFSTVLIF